jgi:septal ring factor EnvC (AmiA/AmiB activator)
MAICQQQRDPLPILVKVGVFFLVLGLGLWGCARKPGDVGSGSDRAIGMSARVQKLEQDYRTVADARDKVRREMIALEEENARLQRELAEKEKERERLVVELNTTQTELAKTKTQLGQRTTERDDLAVQVRQQNELRELALGRVDKMRKGLQELLTRDDQLIPGALLPPPQQNLNAAPAPIVGPATAPQGL